MMYAQRQPQSLIKTKTASCISTQQSLVFLRFGRASESVIPENDGVEKLQLLLLLLLALMSSTEDRKGG